jgi:predicted RNA-binding Zn-ribbon protein involved in translation (DUF1610 family)
MIYVVKCYYCEHEFRVKRGETGADMMCPECGKANNIRDVIERIEEEKTVDPDLQAIKDFDISKHPVINDETCLSWEERIKLALEYKAVRIILGIILFIIIAVIVFFWYLLDKVQYV